MSRDLSPLVTEYIAAQAEKHRKKLEDADKGIAKERDPSALAQLVKKRDVIVANARYDPASWIEDAAVRAAQVSLGTHGTKFTSSDAKGAGGVNAVTDSPIERAVGTHSLQTPELDGICNAGVLDVAVFLLIGKEGVFLWQQVANGDPVSLEPFSDDTARIATWMAGLAKAVGRDGYAPHTLTKQVYFPAGDGHRLVSPLFASSLAHALYRAVDHARFSDIAKEARTKRRDNMLFPHDVVQYTRVARMKFGGSQPQNISLLNTRRRGIAYLLDCAPPRWEVKVSLPVRGERAFWRLYRHRSRSALEAFRTFLERVDGYNNVAIRRQRAAFVEQLVDNLLNLGAEIRAAGKPGWSRSAELPLAEQCFLDPSRARTEAEGTPFALLRASGEWKAGLAALFAAVVNRHLSGMRGKAGRKLRDLGDVEAREWAQELTTVLARLEADLEYLP